MMQTMEPPSEIPAEPAIQLLLDTGKVKIDSHAEDPRWRLAWRIATNGMKARMRRCSLRSRGEDMFRPSPHGTSPEKLLLRAILCLAARTMLCRITNRLFRRMVRNSIRSSVRHVETCLCRAGFSGGTVFSSRCALASWPRFH
jgi:hypothetical protein